MYNYGSSHFDAALTSVAALTNAATDDIIQRSLRAARTHLGLQVAYLSEFVAEEAVYRSVDAPGLGHLIAVGDTRSLDDVYCRHILKGRLPELMPDTGSEPLAAAMPITSAVPIGAHVSVPVRLQNGDIYGMFCCLGPHSDQTLNERDLNVVRCFADMAASEIDRRRELQASQNDKRALINAIIANRLVDIHYQPIWDVALNCIVGYEALSRFQVPDDVRTPDRWFAEAQEIGCGIALETHVIAKALEHLEELPGDGYLAINCSPSTAISVELSALLNGAPLERLILEITEHDKIDQMECLIAALEPLRRAGLRIAVDDAGSGFSGLQQILEFKPEIIKLDRFFVHSIDIDPSRRAMAAALAAFSQSVGCAIIAEGVETTAELLVLEKIGFCKVQGYLLGRPRAIDDLIRDLGTLH